MYRRFFVYILANRPRGVLYIGVTNDLIRRLAEHKGKLVPGFTRTYGVIMLVYYEEYSSILEARTREATLKRWRRAWKIELVDKFNPDWRDLSTSLRSERCACPGCGAARAQSASGAPLIRDRHGP
jgi:putative endonuclease